MGQLNEQLGEQLGGENRWLLLEQIYFTGTYGGLARGVWRIAQIVGPAAVAAKRKW